MDQKGFMMGVALPCKDIREKGYSWVKLTEDGTREWVTVIEAVLGDGPILRLMIINKEQAHYMVWYAKLKKGASRYICGIREGVEQGGAWATVVERGI